MDSAINNFEWIEDSSKSNKDFVKNYNQESDNGHFLKVEFQYPEKLHDLYNNLPFLLERMKTGKVEKLVAKVKYVIHIRNLKQALNHG